MNVLFMGTPRAAVPTLEKLLNDGHKVVAVYTQPDRPSGRGNRVAFSPVKEFAVELGLPILQPVKIRTEEALEQFRAYKADIAIVVAYGRILPGSFLTAFPMGAINVHFSLLPKYRGAAPVNWAIVNGELETGVTTMVMDEGLDTGDILLQGTTPILPDETSIELMGRLSALGAGLLGETLATFDTIPRRKQQDTLASLAPILKKEDGLIDWSISATGIANRVRGFQPFPTAFTYYQGMRLTIWQAKAEAVATDGLGVPGEVLMANGNYLHVRCGGNSLLSISELQLEGKRWLAARDFLNGTSIREGDVLGAK
jgi:methionyl-tRNA formyltransferase